MEKNERVLEFLRLFIDLHKVLILFKSGPILLHAKFKVKSSMFF